MTRTGQQSPTGVLLLDDGSIVWGHGAGAQGVRVGELCFNTAMTGYQEILTDLSYARQIIVFTFPHIGNTGINGLDMESLTPAAQGCIFRAPIPQASSYRSGGDLGDWLDRHGIVALTGIDTRALTRRLRVKGFANGVIAHAPDGVFDLTDLSRQAREWPGLQGMDLAKSVTGDAASPWTQTPWGPVPEEAADREAGGEAYGVQKAGTHHIVALDYGVKHNMLRALAALDCRVTVVSATTPAQDVLALKPDGILLTNGPGDPAATGDYALEPIRTLIDSGKPVMGICLGHQLMALALGAKTKKMHQGHHGANHPVKDLTTGRVEITSMNHGFVVDGDSLPEGVRQTHVSLFDGTNCGLEMTTRPVFSVQYHPEASPGPHDSLGIFKRFTDAIVSAKTASREAS